MLTFTFLPLLGISMALQSISGNNFGAQKHDRTSQTLKIALIISLVYCVVVQAIYFLFSTQLGAIFVDDAATISEVARITPIVTLIFFLSGPLMMIGTFFQAIGDAARAGILLLAKTYLFAIPLTLMLPYAVGEAGIWYSSALAEILLLGLTFIVVVSHKKAAAPAAAVASS
ncbi:MATE family efflux transporter [Pseudovibrio denitrificans]|nr:MATE family efflux transporter [Pseudovibrio denitrificans]